MSKYAVDKVLWQLSHHEDPRLFELYMADPESLFQGRDLAEEERQALKACDIAALYRMGAQPFLLLGWARRVAKARGEPGDAFVERYIATVKPYGNPDFST